MGLDMYVFRATKPVSLEYSNKVYNSSDPVISCFTRFSEEDIKLDMCKQIVPFCVRVHVINHYYDMEKIGKDFNIAEPEIVSLCTDYVGISGEKDGRRTNVDIPIETIKTKYTISKEETEYLTRLQEERYWRKDYEMQDWFYARLNHVENCGFYVLSEEMIAEFNQEYSECPLPIDFEAGSALFYHEWY